MRVLQCVRPVLNVSRALQTMACPPCPFLRDLLSFSGFNGMGGGAGMMQGNMIGMHGMPANMQGMPGGNMMPMGGGMGLGMMGGGGGGMAGPLTPPSSNSSSATAQAASSAQDDPFALLGKLS